MSITFTNGAAVFMLLLSILFILFWMHVIYICIKGGKWEMSFESKGAIPQIKGLLSERKQRLKTRSNNEFKS